MNDFTEEQAVAGCVCSGPGECPLRLRVVNEVEQKLCAGTCDNPAFCTPAKARLRRVRWFHEVRGGAAPLPSKVRMVANYAVAQAKHHLTGAVDVPPEVQEARLSQCRPCEHRIDDPDGRDPEGRCTASPSCGCFLSAKTKRAVEQCSDPKGPRWKVWEG